MKRLFLNETAREIWTEEEIYKAYLEDLKNGTLENDVTFQTFIDESMIQNGELEELQNRKFYSQSREEIITEIELCKEYLYWKYETDDTEQKEQMSEYFCFNDYVLACDSRVGGDLEFIEVK